jgi:hypothetical protein
LAMLAALSASSAGGTYLWSTGPEALIQTILSRWLPGVRIDSASIALLSRDVQADLETTTRRIALHGAAAAARIIGIDAVAKLRPVEVNHLERKVLTLFILRSDFFDVKNPKTDLVTYYPPPWPCGNRFAEYDT